MKKGIFVSLEGLEATGKTTVSKIIGDKLSQLNLTSVLTREPGGISSAEAIRETIMDNELDPLSELFLFLAARKEHLVKKILPSLNEVDVVVTDRYVHTSLAYQGYAKGLGLDLALELNNITTNNTMPDIVFYIDVPAEVSMKRKVGELEQNRLDKMSLDFYEKARTCYLEMAKDTDKYGNIIVIDGMQSIEDVANEILREILSFKGKKEERVNLEYGDVYIMRFAGPPCYMSYEGKSDGGHVFTQMSCGAPWGGKIEEIEDMIKRDVLIPANRKNEFY